MQQMMAYVSSLDLQYDPVQVELAVFHLAKLYGPLVIGFFPKLNPMFECFSIGYIIQSSINIFE